MNCAKSVIYDLAVYVPIRFQLWKDAEDGAVLFLGILRFPSRVCIKKVRLTKNLRGRLMFLDDHMSSSRRNMKHLKVAFCQVCSSGGRSRRGGVRKDKTETGKFSRYRNNLFVCSGGHHACFRCLLYRDVGRSLRKENGEYLWQLSSSL